MPDFDRSHDSPCPDDDVIVRRISFHGLTTEIKAPRQAFADALSLTLGSYAAAAADAPVDLRIRIAPCDYPGWWRVITPDRTYRGSQNVAMAAQQIDWILTTQAVERLPGFIHVHAAVVATATRSVLLIGRSGSGKSTTAVGLATAGLALYTDDVALIDRDTLRPVFVPRPVKLDDDCPAPVGVARTSPATGRAAGRKRRSLGVARIASAQTRLDRRSRLQSSSRRSGGRCPRCGS